jgi:toxin YoeB
MRIEWADEAWEDYLYWQQTNKTALKRVNALIKDIRRDPFAGIGKPEALKHHMSGFWSRRIDDEHRLIYAVNDDLLKIIQCRYHY